MDQEDTGKKTQEASRRKSQPTSSRSILSRSQRMMRLWCWWITFSGIRSLNQQALYQHTWLGTGMSQPTQAMEHAVTSPTTSPLHKMAWLSLRDKDAHCGMERLHFQISIPAAVCWPLSSKDRFYISGAEIAMVVAKDRNTKNTNTWRLNWDAVAVQYFVACQHANCSCFLRFHFWWPSVPLLHYYHITRMELYLKSAN